MRRRRPAHWVSWREVESLIPSTYSPSEAYLRLYSASLAGEIDSRAELNGEDVSLSPQHWRMCLPHVTPGEFSLQMYVSRTDGHTPVAVFRNIHFEGGQVKRLFATAALTADNPKQRSPTSVALTTIGAVHAYLAKNGLRDERNRPRAARTVLSAALKEGITLGVLESDAFSPESPSLRAYADAMLKAEAAWDSASQQKHVSQKKR